jgi:hypothetical protein
LFSSGKADLKQKKASPSPPPLNVDFGELSTLNWGGGGGVLSLEFNGGKG